MARTETGRLTPSGWGVVGSYQYRGTDGALYKVSFTADQNGYRPRWGCSIDVLTLLLTVMSCRISKISSEELPRRRQRHLYRARSSAGRRPRRRRVKRRFWLDLQWCSASIVSQWSRDTTDNIIIGNTTQIYLSFTSMLEGVISPTPNTSLCVPSVFVPSLSGPAIDLSYLPPHYIPSKVGPVSNTTSSSSYRVESLSKYASKELLDIVKFLTLYHY